MRYSTTAGSATGVFVGGSECVGLAVGLGVDVEALVGLRDGNGDIVESGIIVTVRVEVNDGLASGLGVAVIDAPAVGAELVAALFVDVGTDVGIESVGAVIGALASPDPAETRKYKSPAATAATATIASAETAIKVLRLVIPSDSVQRIPRLLDPLSPQAAGQGFLHDSSLGAPPNRSPSRSMGPDLF